MAMTVINIARSIPIVGIVRLKALDFIETPSIHPHVKEQGFCIVYGIDLWA
jgi:hypothetical protein